MEEINGRTFFFLAFQNARILLHYCHVKSSHIMRNMCRGEMYGNHNRSKRSLNKCVIRRPSLSIHAQVLDETISYTIMEICQSKLRFAISMGKEGNVACPSLYFYSAPFLFIIQHTPFSGRRVSALCLARSQTSQVPQALTVSVPSPLSVVPSSADVQHPSPSAFALAYP